MIGIFDSGSGGLTVLRAIRTLLPSVDVLDYGDIKNAPYGSRSRDELSALTVNAMRYLSDNGARSVVSACNSVSASLAISLFDALSIAPDMLVEMVGPTVSYFKGSSARVLLVATPATIDSSIYQSAFMMIGKKIDALAIPDLAGAIEFGKSDAEVEAIIRAILLTVDWSHYDVLVLACTHYPLAAQIFRTVVPGHIIILDPAILVAERVESRFWPREAGDGKTHFVITKDSAPFRRFASELFPDTQYEIEVIE